MLVLRFLFKFHAFSTWFVGLLVNFMCFLLRWFNFTNVLSLCTLSLFWPTDTLGLIKQPLWLPDVRLLGSSHKSRWVVSRWFSYWHLSNCPWTKLFSPNLSISQTRVSRVARLRKRCPSEKRKSFVIGLANHCQKKEKKIKGEDNLGISLEKCDGFASLFLSTHFRVEKSSSA